MPKEELVEGIKQAISKGEPIEKAMMSFYSAGYAKQDIEEAASVVQSPGSFQQPVSQQAKQIIQPVAIQPGVIQRVSAYGPKPPSRKGMAITIVLVAALLLLIGMLVSVILFKDEISSLFGGVWRVLF